MDPVIQILPPGQPVNHPVRLEALRETRLLDTAPEDSFDRYTRLATALLGSEISLITLVDSNRQFFKSQVGLPEPLRDIRETPLSHSFCKHVVEGGLPFVVDDSLADPRVASNPVVSEFGVAAYLGLPLTTRDGLVLGSMCVIDKQPRVWTDTDKQRLADLAAAVIREIELSERSRALRELLVTTTVEEEQRRKQLRISLHDLRNTAGATLTCIGQLTAASANPNPEQADLLERAQSSAEQFLRMVETMQESEQVGPEGLSLNVQVVSASLLARRVMRTLQPLADDADVRVVLDLPDDLIFLNADPRKIERVLLVLLTNAVQCSPAGSAVRVHFHLVEKFGCSMCRISVLDSGPPVVDAEKQEIFQHVVPSLALTARGMRSLRGGLIFCRKIIEAHGGEIRVADAPDGRCAFQFWLPVATVPV